MRILFFGDSIAQGLWDTEHGGWVERLKRDYDRQFVMGGLTGEDHSVFNLSISGDTTNEVLARFDAEAKARVWRGQPLAVVIAVGTNDARIDGDIAFMDRDRYAENLKAIIAKAKQVTDKVLLVGLPACDELSTTPVAWNPDITYTNGRLEQFEQTATSVATAANVLFVPLFSTFRLRAAEGAQLWADGLHPNETGHMLIFEQVKPALDRLLAAGTA